PDLVAGVFVGFDTPRTLGAHEQGSTVAAPIFRDFMKGALADAPATPFRVAPGIELIPVDARTGTPVPEGTPGSIMEAFKAGTAFADEPVLGMAEYGFPQQQQAQPAPNQPPPASVGEGTG